MAAIPNFETLLLAVHEALGRETPRKKQELRDLRRPVDQHLQALDALLDDILSAIGFDDAAKADAKWNLLEFTSFHKALEIGTWTFGAEARQVAWYLLAWVYVPGLARHAAFWQLAHSGDAGMPGGDFWYLPRVDTDDGASTLRMPVAAVLDWLEDLLGQPVHRAAIGWNNGQTKVDPESAKRTLAKWRDGDVPRSSIIETYFAEGTEFAFRNCLCVPVDADDQAALAAMRAFVERRDLTPGDLRLQIAMAEDRIEAVLADVGTADDTARFSHLMRERYAQPSLRTVRNRLLLARAVQYAHRELASLLTPGVDPGDPDPHRNKTLQLLGIFKRIYNLTIQAAAVSRDAARQDTWFEEQLAPWERGDLFLSILPSKRRISAQELPEVLTQRFASLKPNQSLEDWWATDTGRSVALLESRRARWVAEVNDIETAEAVLRMLRSQAPEAALAALASHAAARNVAMRHQAADVRLAAARRMTELADTDEQRLDAALIHMDIHLNGQLQPEPANAQALVEDLLRQAEANPCKSRRRPQLLNARAKHCLRSNDFAQARTLFKQALDACNGDSCGDLPGLIARDLFALDTATRPNGYYVANFERHVRIMAAFDVINGLDYPIEDVERYLAAYFRDDLYRPYRTAQTTGQAHSQFPRARCSEALTSPTSTEIHLEDVANRPARAFD